MVLGCFFLGGPDWLWQGLGLVSGWFGGGLGLIQGGFKVWFRNGFGGVGFVYVGLKMRISVDLFRVGFWRVWGSLGLALGSVQGGLGGVRAGWAAVRWAQGWLRAGCVFLCGFRGALVVFCFKGWLWLVRVGWCIDGLARGWGPGLRLFDALPDRPTGWTLAKSGKKRAHLI